jgi:hypothetical protein
MERLEQWTRTHPFLSTALGAILGAVFTAIIGPILVSLFLSFVGDAFAVLDVTVDPNFYPGYEGHAIEPPVIVDNAGEATAENCVVKVTNMYNQEEFKGPDVFSVPPDQDYPERLTIPVPNLPKSKTPGKVRYRIRAVCSNDVSPDSFTWMEVY